MSLSDLNAQLEALELRKAKAKKDQAVHGELLRMRTQLIAAQREAEAQLHKENEDVTDLEKVSLTSILAKLKGDWEERLTKEQREAVAAKVRYDMATEEVDRINFKIQELEDSSDSLPALQRDYHLLLQKKEELLRLSGSSVGHELVELQRALADCLAQLREVGEAIAAAQTALNKLEEMGDELLSAANLGTWDMLGGGMLVTLAKHSRMDNAQALGQQVSRALSTLKTELADVDVGNLEGDISPQFASFADLWLDGFFVDFYIQSQISEAQRNTERVYQDVKSIRYKLRLQRELLEEQEKNLRARQRELLDQH